MKLPFFEKKPKVEYFLSLVLRDDKINVFVFEQTGAVIKIVNSQEESFSDSLDKTSYEDLLDASDKVISQAEDELDLPIEIQKTIFGLKDTWVKDAKIKPEYLETLKKLSDSLGLVPVGFLTISEAVVSLLQKEEGAPPSAILCDVGKNTVTVSSVRAGKVIEVKTAEVHQTPVFTVDTLLKHFEIVEILPAKVVLLNEDEELVQEFISHQWSKSLPFLHLPQIVSLESGSIGKAFVIGLANQTGAQVLTEFETETVEEKVEQNEEPTQEEVEQVEPGEPIEPEQVKQTEEVESKIQFVNSPDYFGFIDKDVAEVPPPKPETTENIEPQVFEEIPEEVGLKETQKQLIPSALLVVLPKAKAFAFNLLSKIKGANIKGLKIPNLPGARGPLLFIALPAAFLLLLVIYYLFFLKANVVLSVTPKVEQKSLDITFSVVSSDFKSNTVKADFVSVSEDGASTTITTGKKETGDKAKGTVTIFNNSNITITYPAQTTITSSNKLDFLTDSKVTVASSSGDVFSGTKPGTANANLNASTFGTEYNLPSGTKFTVGTNASVAAKNDNPFSGGTKKEIQVVSKDDVAKLQNDLIKSLEEKAKTDIKGKLTSSKDLLPNFIDESIDKKSLDKNVDEEAKSANLTGTVSFQSLSYDKDEFLNFIKTLFPANESINKDNIELSFENLKKVNESTVTAKMNVKVKIIPKIDTQALSKKISGQSFIKAKNNLSGTSQVSNVTIKFSPNLGFLPNILPRISRNIKITISENE